AGPQGVVGIRPAEMVKRLPANESAAQCRALLGVMLGQFLALCFESDLSAAQPPSFEDLEQCVFGVSLQAIMPTGKEQGTLRAGAGSPCLLKTTKPFDWGGSVRKWFPKAEKMSHAGRDYLRTPWKSDLLKKMFPQRADAGEVYMAVFVPDERT